MGATEPAANTNSSEEGRVKSLDDRFGAIETEQAEQRGLLEQISSAVQGLTGTGGKLTPASHTEAQQRTEDRLDRPSSVQEQVRAELARAQAERQAEADKDAAKSEREQMLERMARLEEKAPRPPVPWRTRMLGWGDR